MILAPGLTFPSMTIEPLEKISSPPRTVRLMINGGFCAEQCWFVAVLSTATILNLIDIVLRYQLRYFALLERIYHL